MVIGLGCVAASVIASTFLVTSNVSSRLLSDGEVERRFQPQLLYGHLIIPVFSLL